MRQGKNAVVARRIAQWSAGSVAIALAQVLVAPQSVPRKPLAIAPEKIAEFCASKVANANAKVRGA